MGRAKICGFVSSFWGEYYCREPALPNSKERYCIFHEPSKNKDIKKFNEGIQRKLMNKDYNFRGYFFPGKADFFGKAFEAKADFVRTTFKDAADFTRATFESEVNLAEATFEGKATFFDSTFKGEAHFPASKFKDSANFGSVRFERRANFFESTFEDFANFAFSTFEDRADFQSSTFKSIGNFHRSRFERKTYFVAAFFKYKGNAEIPFRATKISFHEVGDYTSAGEFYYLERVAKRKNLTSSNKQWLEYLFVDLTCGYGERPRRVITLALVVILGLGALYWKIGHIIPSKELFAGEHALTFLDSLYFSVVTFTTLGFGDWHPDPSHWIRYMVMVEAFIGAVMMALFVMTFGRKMMR